MEVETEGLLRHLINFGSLFIGEAFVYKDETYVKNDDISGFGIETNIVCRFASNLTVHKVNLKVVPTGERNE